MTPTQHSRMEARTYRIACVKRIAVALGLLVIGWGSAPAAHAQHLEAACAPWTLWGGSCPVMDLARRWVAAEYDDRRDVEYDRKRVEQILSAIESSNLGSFVFQDAAAVLGDVEWYLDIGTDLGYSSANLIAALDALFTATLAPGYDPYAGAPARYDELLRTYRTMGVSGQRVAEGIAQAAGRVEDTKRQIEDIGQFLGFSLPGMGSPRQSAQSELQMAMYSAEELLQMRQAITMQTNAEILEYMDAIADDRMAQVVLDAAIYGPALPPPPL